MQLDPALTRPLTSLTPQGASDSRSPVKRSYSQQAVQPLPRATFSPVPPAKKPRSASPLPPQSASTATRQTKAMPPSSNRHRASEAGPSSQSRRKPLRNQPKPKARKLPRDLMEGPFHDEDYIEREHKKSPIPLKAVHKNTPKSAVNNFYVAVKNCVPEYVSVPGTVLVGDELCQIWR